MKKRPILFSTPMVIAVLDDSKSMTRRTKGLNFINESPDNWEYVNTSDKLDFPRPVDCKYPENTWYYWNNISNNSISFITQCPYGQIGDILWVRENFYALGKWVKNGTTKTGKQKYKFSDHTIKMGRKYMYEVNSEKPTYVETKKDGLIHWYKRPSIFMPKEACRIRLEITNRRVERLQDICEDDAVAEGIEITGTGELGSPVCYRNYLPTNSPKDIRQFTHSKNLVRFTTKDSYMSLWESINGKGSWDKNPWLWVISFKQL